MTDAPFADILRALGASVMFKLFKILTGAIALAGMLGVAALWAQQPVATVTSSASFTLRGAAVSPGQGVAMWPVMAGDAVQAGNAVTIITFPDGSVITLDPMARAIVNFANGKPVFQLVSGTAHYSLKSLTAVQMVASGQTVAATTLNGVISPSGLQAAGFWTAGHVAAVAAGGAGAGAAIGGVAAATSGGTPESAQ